MSNSRFAEIVELMHGAMLGEISWQDFLAGYVKRTNQQAANFMFHDIRSGLGAATLGSGISSRALQDYTAHFAGCNPWMGAANRMWVGRATISDDLIDRHDLARTEYYNDFLKPNGFETGMGVVINRDADCLFLLSLMGSDLSTRRNRAESELQSQLARHLRRVSGYYLRNRLRGLNDLVPTRLAEQAGVGMVTVDLNGRLLAANDLGAAYLEAGSLIGQSRKGVVQFRSVKLAAVFDRMRRGLSSPERAVMHAQTGYEGCHEICMVPHGLNDASAGMLGATIAILITRNPAQELAERHQLSPAEARVAHAVIAGQKPAEIAANCGLSLATIRSQLKSVFAKTGITSQSELVRLGHQRSNGIAME